MTISQNYNYIININTSKDNFLRRTLEHKNNLNMTNAIIYNTKKYIVYVREKVFNLLF